MVELGKRAKFFAAHVLVQELQHAKLQLQLPALLRKLDRYDLLVLDDLGYVKKSEAETSVLFELIAHRYERKSLLITANQPFSQWDSIFSDSILSSDRLNCRPFFIADNNGFDWQFINWYFHHFCQKNPFGHTSSNLGSFSYGKVSEDRIY